MPNTKPIGVAYSDPLLESFAVGTSAQPIAVNTSSNVTSAYATNSATNGDVRLSYNKLIFTAAGSGETLRAFTSLATNAGSVAVGGTVNGAHISLEIDGAAKVSGAGNALRATLGGTSTNPGGTLAAIQADSSFATGGTWTNASFIRFTNSGTGTVTNLLNVPAAMVVVKGGAALSHKIQIVDSAGKAYYIMVSDA